MNFNILKYLILLIILSVYILIYIEYNTKFKIINKIPKYKTNTLFLVTHNYEHKVIFIIFKIFGNLPQTYYILFADKLWNKLLEYIKPSNLIFIYVKKNTVNKISSKLLLNNNVIMFLYKENESSGSYYIMKNTNCNLILIQIKSKLNYIIKNHYNSSFLDIYLSNFNKLFEVYFKKIKYNVKTLNNFMFILKDTLYNK